jgi:hypothetical protein
MAWQVSFDGTSSLSKTVKTSAMVCIDKSQGLICCAVLDLIFGSSSWMFMAASEQVLTNDSVVQWYESYLIKADTMNIEIH